jgi:hypothetical protein
VATVPESPGHSISRAFSGLPSDATATGQEVRRTLREIDSLHSTGTQRLSRIPIEEEINPTRFGAYARPVGGNPVRITVERDGDHKGLTTAHEIGHFLDHQALGTPGEFASEANLPEMAGWRMAVD